MVFVNNMNVWQKEHAFYLRETEVLCGSESFTITTFNMYKVHGDIPLIGTPL